MSSRWAAWREALQGRPLLVSSLAALGMALVVAGRTLGYPWFWDDYHLIRPFSGAELASAFSGPWDVDGIETPSYRPLWVLFNHLRALVFGENMVLHRMFSLGAFAAFVSLMALTAQRQGLRLPFALGALALMTVTKSNHANLMWLTDTTHAAGGIPVALGCLLAAAPPTGQPWRRALTTFALSLVGLLVREDVAALFPLWVLLEPASTTPTPWALRLRGLVERSVPLLLSTGLYFALRTAFVPNGLTRFRAQGFFNHLTMTVEVLGTKVPAPFYWLWLLLAGAVLVGGLAVDVRDAPSRVNVLVWTGCALLGCTPGVVQERSNLLLIPSTLFACALAMAAERLLARTRRREWGIGLALATAAFVCTGYVEMSKALLSGHPESLETIQYAGDFLYGRYSPEATIPRRRQKAGKAYLAKFGIHSRAAFNGRMHDLRQDAASRPPAPDSEGRPFAPPNRFLRL